MRTKLLVFGMSPFAEMVAHSFESRADFTVVAQTAHFRFLPIHWTGERPIVPFEEIEAKFDPKHHQIVIALEHARQNLARAEIAAEASAKGYRLASFIDPSANIAAGIVPGSHCLIFQNVVAQWGVRLGENVIVGANCFFGQNVTLGPDSYFGNGVFVDRLGKIGRHCVVGSQVQIAEGIEIGDWAYIQPFQKVFTDITRPTLTHRALRGPGHIVDRRGS